MAKKTAKKQPLKVAVKGASKTVKKVVKKTSDSVKAKSAKLVPKKEKKIKPVVGEPIAKKTLEKKPAEKKEKKQVSVASILTSSVLTNSVKVKTKTKNADPEGESVVESSEVGAVVPAANKSEVIPSKKKTAQQKKKEKLEIDSNVKWADLYEKYKQIKPLNYSMKDIFEANQPIQHKVLGWGWVISSENDRLEVLFKDGKKILISNYRP